MISFMPKLIIALLFFVFSMPLKANSDVSFSGTLVEEPCLLDPNDSAFELDMGTVIAKMLYSHTRMPGKPFSLHLLECDLSLGNTISITFLGTEDLEQPGLIALGAGSTAKGVALGIETPQNILIPVNKPSVAQPLQEGANTLSLQYFISASKSSLENKLIKPGTVNYVMPFALEYE